MSDIVSRLRCETCGGEVKVVPADEGTSHYEPVEVELRAEIERLQAELEQANATTIHDETHVWKDFGTSS